MADSPSHRRWIVFALKVLILVVVCLGVGRTFLAAVDQLSPREWQFRPAWLAAAGLLYLAGLLPMAWFWRRALASLGQPAPWRAVVYAYFLGHLGKYVPGKALVVVLRVAALGSWVTSYRAAIVSVVLETLTMMATGGFLAAVLAVAVLRLDVAPTMLAIALAVAAGLPTLPLVARRLATLGTAPLKEEASDVGQAVPDMVENMLPDNVEIDEVLDTRQAQPDLPLRAINYPLLASGWVAAAVCWTLLGMSLWATLWSIGVELDLLAALPLMVATVSLAVVAGFLSLLPGGIVVRDALLMQLLASACSEADALVAAVLLRLVWLVSEVAICGILYVGARSKERGAGSKNA